MAVALHGSWYRGVPISAVYGRSSRPRADEPDAFRRPGVRRCRSSPATAPPALVRSASGAVEIGGRPQLGRISRFSRFSGTGDISGSCGPRARELLTAAPTPLLRCSPLEFVEEPIVLAHTASHGSPGRTRACVNSPVSSIARDAKGAQWCPGGHRPVSGASTVSTYTCRERLVAALRHGA